MRRALALALIVGLASCKGAGGADMVADAALMTAIAAGTSVARRSTGDCYVPCDFGTYCDTRTGTCEALPCHNTCKDDEVCDQTGGLDRCVPASWLQVRAQMNGPPASAPFSASTPAPAPAAATPAPAAPARDVPAANPTPPSKP